MKKFLTSPVRLWICVVSIFVMLLGIGTWGFAKGYWDWDKKQIFQLNAHKICPPETPGNNYTLDIGLASRTTNLYGTINLLDGYEIDINSGGEIDVESGGKIEVASGGYIYALNGSYIDTSGELNILYNGDLDIQNGGEINVESGGLIDVLSGGEIDINSGATLDVNGNVDFTGSTITATGLITATHIADETREWTSFDLVSAYVDAAGPITTATAPALEATALDNIPAIRYDNSGETVGISWTRRVPTNYKTGQNGGLLVYVTVSTGTRTANRTFSDLGLDWLVWLNRDGTAFASTEYAQSTVTCGAASEMDRSNEVLTLYASSALVNAIQAGDWLTFEFFNASTSGLEGYQDDLEIKGISVHAVFTK